ncbi:3-oxoacid CoA-transferase subunit A [Rhodobium orientis]|uniref:Acetyl-CoA--acetoacetyl-CoA transferase subunit alpha n=1 Tax=Rhodobium orientis TaxID=34017 RepID=A0A327JSI1_9HYPH|nr:3-oxoacid CoA-transferase subunit A [Rhodobium orientis]MBK5951643.1 acetyl-CoA--acetoacetyl-CoA transferase subunit alpha [Rhodobium orientis]RAI27842.1 acetyl-CoA--acetoacetyl-CoA transferase subunit alpha [Rhodobium orientis]
MSKLCSCACAVESITDGSSVMIGGFMGGGSPHRLIDELVRQGKKDLTIIANDTARPGFGIGKLVDAGALKRLIASHIGLNPETQKRMIAEEIEVELVPQGTLAERIRAGGTGLGGVLTATGVGTVVADGKPTLELDGETYLVETPLKADFALIHALRADLFGNLQYQLTARNFNPSMALAATTVVAEAAEIVPVGMIPPDHVETVGVIVDHLISREA